MAINDFYQEAVLLKVVDVWRVGNETGWVTPRILYAPSLGMAPALGSVDYYTDHGTAGVNTLQFWGEGGSAIPGNWTVAHFLVPHETTRYRDGTVRDTSHIVFKMVPDGYAANHMGYCAGGVDNTNSIGVEHESLQNGTPDISEHQTINSSLLCAYNMAAHHIRDAFRVSHGIVAVPWGRRSDPWAGNYDIARSWEIIQAVRRDARIWQFWGLPQPHVA